MTLRSDHHRSAQRGVGTVTASLVLLFALSMLVFYFNRHVLFEQRTAMNQARSMQSVALAQGGLDWVVARLNDPSDLQAACTFGGPGRARDLVAAPSNDAVHAACLIGAAGALSCACSMQEAPAAWPEAVADAQGFVAQWRRHADDAQAVHISAVGCVNAAEPCGGAVNGDATSSLQVVARAQPLLWRRPVAAVTSGGGVDVCAPARLGNADSATPGWWAHAGRAVDAQACGSPAFVGGVPGSVAASHGSDGVLAARASASDAFFGVWFGTSMADYRAVACRAQGDSPSARGASLRRQHSQGCRRLLADDDIEFSADMALGSAVDPVALVVRGRVAFAGATTVHGLIYVDSDAAAAVTWAQLRWRGAMVARGPVSINTGVEGHFDDGVLQRLSERAAVMVAVPGSWRDE